MKMEDFEFIRKDINGVHEDYYFKVSGESKEQLTKKYYKHGMVEVAKCIYSKGEDVIGIQRQYPFNYDVIIIKNTELKNILISLIDLHEMLKGVTNNGKIW